MALEHDFVGGLRIRAAGLEVVLTTKLLIVVGRSALQRQDVLPPIHHAVILREETMTANIHTVAIVLDGTGDSTEFTAGFEECDVVLIGAAVLKKFVCGGQTRRATTDDYDRLLIAHVL